MARSVLLFLALSVSTLSGPSPARAQLPIGPSLASTADFVTWNGSGFDPVPTSGHLDSDEWRPFGTGVTPPVAFGGTCGTTSSTMATSGGPGFYAITPAASFPPTTVLAMHASDTGLSPGGIVLRLVNGDASAAIHRADVQLRWAQRMNIATSADTLIITADDCGAHGVPYPIPLGPDAITTIHGTGAASWQTHDAMLTLDTSAAPLMPGDYACITFTIGTIGGLRDVIALGSVTVTVPPSTCGDGFVDPATEDCEPNGTTTPCGCDVTCHFPTTECVDGDTNPCTSGVCLMGTCHPTPITASTYVAACNLDGNPCTFEGCISGMCGMISHCMPESACFTCDPTLLSCAVPVAGMAGCCATDDDCSTTCVIGTCVAGTCTTRPDPGCADSSVRDGGTIAQSDAGTDGGANASDAGRTGIDGGPVDGGTVVITPGNHFGGGGGCRCRAGGTRDASGTAWALVVLAMMIARRRRRR